MFWMGTAQVKYKYDYTEIASLLAHFLVLSHIQAAILENGFITS